MSQIVTVLHQILLAVDILEQDSLSCSIFAILKECCQLTKPLGRLHNDLHVDITVAPEAMLFVVKIPWKASQVSAC